MPIGAMSAPPLFERRPETARRHTAWLIALAWVGCGGSSADRDGNTGPPGSTIVSASKSTVTLSPDSLTPGALSVISVIPQDAAGARLGAGLTVVIRSASGSAAGTFSEPAFNTDDSTYRATFLASAAGTPLLLEVRINGTLLNATPRLTVSAGTPKTPLSADINLTVDASATFAISPYIYGGNFIDDPTKYTGGTPPTEMTFNRMGGNRLTAYNWENNFSNAGFDFNWQNDRYLNSSTTPGEAVKHHASRAFSRNQAFMATIPMIGYVAANDCTCNVGVSDSDRAERLARHFRVSKSTKGAAFTTSPNTGDGFVYQDEFVNWFETTFPGRSSHATAPVFFSLDNEPDIWASTHREIMSNIGDNASTPRHQTYSGFIDSTIAYATAIKAVAPNALIFGPAVATYTGIANLGRYPLPDPVYGTQQFLDVYLDRLRTASATAGKRLVDVVDVHYYPAIGTSGGEITNDYAPQDSSNIWARVQGPRSLWDATFNERSWVNNYLGAPIRLLPRLRDRIAAHYPGTKIAITEYYFGRGGDISGGVAQADVLGIFGREGVFAAAVWPIAGVYAPPYLGDGSKAYAYVFSAFRMFRNYDGNGGKFGDTGLRATTSNDEASSIYASRDASGRIVLMLINKMQIPKVARIAVTGAGTFASARPYTLTAASPNPSRQPEITVGGGSNIEYTMPALSVTTLVLTP